MDALEDTSGQQVGQAILHKTINELGSIIQLEDVAERFQKLDAILQMSSTLAQGFPLILAASLAVVEDMWDDLPLDLRMTWDNQFRIYAEKRTPHITWTTLQNHMRAARTFILKGIEPPEGIEFEPIETDISKLVICRSVAEKGQLNENPKLWKLLTDENTTVQDIREELFSPASKEAGISLELKFELLGPLLIAKENGEEVQIAEFDWEAYQNNELAEKAINRILKYLNVVMDEEIIHYLNKKAKKLKEKRNEKK